jgi:excisionase family DNA binding protein
MGDRAMKHWELKSDGGQVIQSMTVLLDPREAAAVLKVSTKTVHKLVRERKLACVQLTARERRFTPEQVQDYIQAHKTTVRVDKKAPRPVSSPPRKGGEKSSGVLSRQALLKEMRKCR